MFSLVTNEFPKWNISANLISIKKSEKINFFYLLVFLNSKFGQHQILRKLSGELHPKITTDDIKSILVFIPPTGFQLNIQKYVNEALKQRKLSEKLYQQAEALLLQELGLRDFKPQYHLSYTTTFSNAFNSHRIDAEYFQSIYEEVIKKLTKKVEVKPFKNFILKFQKGIEVGSENYQEEGKPFIRVSNLSIHGLIKRDQKYINEDLYNQLKENYVPRLGDFLLTKDATPGIAYAVKEPIEGIIASGILKLDINESEINKEYLALCINTIIGKMQIERDGGGSVITHWRPEQIKNLQIPILPPPETQQKIALLVQQSHSARRKAKELLEEAKRKVEKAIENEINK